MYFRKMEYKNIPEFLKSGQCQNISCTVLDTGVIADEKGKKIVLGGTLLDGNGNVIKITKGANDAYTLSADPIGILLRTTDLTYGPQPGALLIDGSVNAERLQGEYIVEALSKIIEKLPFIKFFIDGVLQIK